MRAAYAAKRFPPAKPKALDPLKVPAVLKASLSEHLVTAFAIDLMGAAPLDLLDANSGGCRARASLAL